VMPGEVGFVIGASSTNSKILLCWFDKCRSGVHAHPSMLGTPRLRAEIQALVLHVGELYGEATARWVAVGSGASSLF
jgi:hypothetical protein